MKKLFLLIIILGSNLFAQNTFWNTSVTTSISDIPQMTDLFTNSSGNHILIQGLNSSIVYYRINSEGIVNESSKETFETIGYFPNIIGTNDKIFAIYKTGNYIRTKYSTDNGDTWYSNIPDIQTTAYFCNGVDAVIQEGLTGGVHLVWATQVDETNSNYETYYYKLTNTTPYQWGEGKNVTDVTSYQYGGNPSVTVSPNRVHVSFNTDNTNSTLGRGEVKTRDKYYSSWQPPQTVVSNSESIDDRLLVRGDYLYLFYNCYRDTDKNNDLRYKKRYMYNNTWTDLPPIESETLSDFEDAFEITKDNDNTIHLVYKKFIQYEGWLYTHIYSVDGTSWSTPETLDSYGI